MAVEQVYGLVLQAAGDNLCVHTKNLTSCISQPPLENVSCARAYRALSSALLQEVY